MHSRLGEQRRANSRAHSLRNDRIHSGKLLVGGCVLRKQRDSFLHDFARDRAADRHLAGVSFQLFITRASGNRKEFCLIGVLFVDNAFGEQGDHAIRRSGTKDDVGSFFENLVEVKSRAQRFAHFVKLAEDVRLALQRLEHFVARRARRRDCGLSLTQNS